MPPFLLDTNVLVYAFDLRDSSRQRLAQDLLERVESEGTGRLSVQCLAEFFRATTQKMHLPASEMYFQVEHWRDAFPIFNLTSQIVLEAARGVRDHGMAYYDAQIWAAARLNQVPILFSEDFQDGQDLEGVRFVDPFSKTFNLENWL